jgi:hypothetical protein
MSHMASRMVNPSPTVSSPSNAVIQTGYRGLRSTVMASPRAVVLDATMSRAPGPCGN